MEEQENRDGRERKEKKRVRSGRKKWKLSKNAKFSPL